MRVKRIIVAVTAVAAVTGLAACGGGNSASGGANTATTTITPMPTVSDTSAPFGSACAHVPPTGPGSFNGMATAPVATAANANPMLTQLVKLVGAANLGTTLNSKQDITVFAPDDDAFGKVPPATVKTLLADPNGKLASLLEYHVVGQRITPAELASGNFTSLSGQKITTSGSGQDYTVNGGQAHVVCGNVRTANATVYIIDGVLMPPAS